MLNRSTAEFQKAKLCATGYRLAFRGGQAYVVAGSESIMEIPVKSADVLARPEIEVLITAGIAQAKTPLPTTGGGRLHIRSVSEKQKSRRK